MLRPDIQWNNPVMFVVEVGTVLTLLFIVQMLVTGTGSQVPITYFVALDVWLFLTVLFANFATALAEARGKAQADSLRRTRRDTLAFRLRPNGNGVEEVSSMQLRPGDRVVVEAGQVIPGDGEIIEGVASVDESAITGESAPVIREAGGDRSGVTGGTARPVRPHRRAHHGRRRRVVPRPHDRPGRRGHPAAHAERDRADARALRVHADLPDRHRRRCGRWRCNAEQYMMAYLGIQEPLNSLGTDVPTLVALLVCLIPTTIGALLAAIGIAGMDRALRANIIAKSGKAVEVAGDIDTLLLDKTGTITMGNRRATQVRAARRLLGVPSWRVLAALASVADQTPEGKSIVRPRRRSRRDGGQRGPAAHRGVHPVHRPDPHERHRPARRHAASARALPMPWCSSCARRTAVVPDRLARDGRTSIASRGATPLRRDRRRQHRRRRGRWRTS